MNVISHTTTTQKVVQTNFILINNPRKEILQYCLLQVILASLSAGVVLLSVLARYLGRRKTSRPIRRPRVISGRRTRNSMRSPNGNINSSSKIMEV